VRGASRGKARSSVPGAEKHPRGLLCRDCNFLLGTYEWKLAPIGAVCPRYDSYLAEPPAQKLRYAQTSMPTMAELEERGGARWCLKEEDDE
jgi:hypothetical protein